MNLIVIVGPGGSPDENGETTIDALLMNGVNASVNFVLNIILILISLLILKTTTKSCVFAKDMR